MEYHWARKLRRTLDFSIPTSWEHCLNDFFGDRAKTCMTSTAILLSVELLFLTQRPLNTSCTVPSTSNLSRILVIVFLVGGGVPNSTLQLMLNLNNILQPFRHFTYVISHSSTLPLLYLHHSSFSNPSVASPTSQFILQHLFRFSYVTSSFNSPGEPPMAFIE